MHFGNVVVSLRDQEIYQQIDELSQNVHEYFLDAPNSKTAALKAQNNAKVLKKDADELS